jgi:RNA polymerase sigma factor (sigma-70 family)
MNELDDILKAQVGDREAFGRIVMRYRDLVYGICYGMTAQGVDAEDLTHEAFVEAFLKLHSLREPERFAGWLRTLTSNVCRMWHRQKKREYLDVWSDKSLDDTSRKMPLNGYFSKLSEPHRMALALHYWEGLSYEEMARFLAIPIGTVMSRLSRAKRALKDVMEQSEDMHMVDVEGRDLQVEVDAEIDVLLKLFGEDVDSMERLSIVLENSPDRFRQVICQVEDGATVEQVGMLVRHFGQSAVEATLGCYFDGDVQDKAKAFAVLQFLIHTWVGKNPEKTYTLPMVPGAYLVLDAVMQSAHSVDAQVALLVDLLECADGSVRMVFACVLRGYETTAFDVLMTRFQEITDVGICHKAEGFLSALRFFGSRFLKDILAFLRSEDPHTIRLGLQGAGGVAGVLDKAWVDSQSAQARTLGRRTQGLLFADQMDGEVLSEMTNRISDLVSHPKQDIRIWAIDLLKSLPLGVHLVKLRTCLSAQDQETQVAAMRTLAELGDRGCVQILIDAAKTREGLVLRKTIEALGHLRAPEAQPLMEALLNHTDRGIQEAAILGLGNVGNEDARRKLREMTASSDKKIARLAARAIYGGDQYRHRPKSSALTRARLQKIRGDARPDPMLHRSVVAAVRCLPEVRVYEEIDLTRRIAKVCGDYSTTRRHLVSGRDRLMTRDQGLYTFTPLGEAVWRVEHFIQERFLSLERY